MIAIIDPKDNIEVFLEGSEYEHLKHISEKAHYASGKLNPTYQNYLDWELYLQLS